MKKQAFGSEDILEPNKSSHKRPRNQMHKIDTLSIPNAKCAVCSLSRSNSSQILSYLSNIRSSIVYKSWEMLTIYCRIFTFQHPLFYIELVEFDRFDRESV